MRRSSSVGLPNSSLNTTATPEDICLGSSKSADILCAKPILSSLRYWSITVDMWVSVTFILDSFWLLRIRPCFANLSEEYFNLDGEISWEIYSTSKRFPNLLKCNPCLELCFLSTTLLNSRKHKFIELSLITLDHCLYGRVSIKMVSLISGLS